MLTVPTTPRQSDPGLPNPGGWPPACLNHVIKVRTLVAEMKSEASTAITGMKLSRSEDSEAESRAMPLRILARTVALAKGSEAASSSAIRYWATRRSTFLESSGTRRPFSRPWRVQRTRGMPRSSSSESAWVVTCTFPNTATLSVCRTGISSSVLSSFSTRMRLPRLQTTAPCSRM